MANETVVRAFPSRLERLQNVGVIILGALFFGIFAMQGIDAVFPEFLVDGEFETNRIRTAAVVVVIAGGLIVYSHILNRPRHLAVYPDRLEIGRPVTTVVSFDDLTRIRLGAPMPGLAKTLVKVNKVAGAVSARNQAGAAFLERAYANVVVVDTDRESIVFHIGTIQGGIDALKALVDRNPGKLAEAEFTDNERKRFGRFLAGVYPRE